MISQVENFLIENNINNVNIIIGFSSGADSCALALILKELKDRFNLKVYLANFNHNWRQEALLEEKFTQDFALKNGFEYIIGKAPENSAHSEEVARDLRYSFFNETAKKLNSKHVFLAHNKNDNIETLIYRVIKGTSIKGLNSIPQVRDIYYRPLLNIEKKEILEFLKEKNQEYMEDSSNQNEKYKRNFIRKKILPLFEQINPQYVNSINNLILNSIQSTRIIENELELVKKQIYIEDKISYEKYINLEIELRLEILNDFIGKYLKYRNRKNLLMYDDFILQNKHSKTSLNSDFFLRTRWKKIFIEKG